MDFLKDLSLDKVRNLAEDAINQAKPKTEVEARVYEVLSHKNWGSSSTLMNEIARDTFDYDKFAIVSQLMWESMENQRPAAWRVVFKGLTLLEHLIKHGSERVVDDARNHGHVLRSLHQFNYYEGTIDRGKGVREKSKQLVEMLSDDERIREERQKARTLREKFGGNLGGNTGGGGGGGRYAGYGNDAWNHTGNGGGYGDGGIDSNASGDGGRSSGGYGGRYDEDRRGGSLPSAGAVRAGGSEPAPTFAALPDETPRKSKKKGKKKKKDDSDDDDDGFAAKAPAPAAPEIDLFSFDDPTSAPASAAPEAEDGFGDFQAIGSKHVDNVANDPFASPAPAAAPVAAANQFDSFAIGGGGGAVTSNDQFGDFAGSSRSALNNHASQQRQFNAFVGMGGGPLTNTAQMMGSQPGGGMSGVGFSSNSGIPSGQQSNDDDFGDFAAATPALMMNGGGNAMMNKPMGMMSSRSTEMNKDPMSKLISLDGLSRNSDKQKKSTLSQPVASNDAARNYIQQQDAIQQNIQQHAGGHISFHGIDGLQKPGFSGGNMQMMPASIGSNPNVMGSGNAGGSSAIDAMDPSMMKRPPQQQGGVGGGFASRNQQSFGNMQGGGYGGNNMSGGGGFVNTQGMGQQSVSGFGGMNSNMQGMGNFGGGGGMMGMQGIGGGGGGGGFGGNNGNQMMGGPAGGNTMIYGGNNNMGGFGGQQQRPQQSRDSNGFGGMNSNTQMGGNSMQGWR